MKTPNLKNAVEMSELSADFEALDHVSRYYLLFPGDYAKVCVEFSDHKGYTGERFWVRVTSAEPGQYRGVVDNDLEHTEAHGLRYGDLIAFDYRHIFDLAHQSKLSEWVKEIEDGQEP
ncbi:hypothetical protein [Roseimicrobium sp. ORNL1]|uniref:hypothetical protein n=1 Tax=Roseimicrobium sp. ORNL1 TaxID=2711231 RepID=UPI0013E0F13C|nr:hypothetical protein [Roseimicrobium sp. ORNL1]QIF04149.1 hypothetical protein G5S37_22345 [Roseimicrobium sp. ORNL1]